MEGIKNEEEGGDESTETVQLNPYDGDTHVPREGTAANEGFVEIWLFTPKKEDEEGGNPKEENSADSHLKEEEEEEKEMSSTKTRMEIAVRPKRAKKRTRTKTRKYPRRKRATQGGYERRRRKRN